MMWRVLNNRHGLALMFIVFFERRDNFKIIIEISIFFSDSAKIEIVIFAESLLDLFWQQLLNVAELNDFIIFVVMSLCTLVEVVDLQHSAQ